MFMRICCKWFGKRQNWSNAKELELITFLTSSKKTEIVNDESLADVIIVFNKHLTPVHRFDLKFITSKYFIKHRQKILIYDETDLPTFIIPGIYVSTNSNFMGDHVLPVPYLKPELYGTLRNIHNHRHLTGSFWGRPSHPVRTDIYSIQSNEYSIKNTSHFDFFDMSTENQRNLEKQRREYYDILIKSKYSLCPRGFGTCSIRLFESILCGAVPVIISDRYVPPTLLDWNMCAIFVQESKTKCIREHIDLDIPNYREKYSTLIDQVIPQFQAPTITNYIYNNLPKIKTSDTLRRLCAYLMHQSRVKVNFSVL